jgi:3-phosphoshikimate 1-carboxyvinyltransferase
MKYVLIYPSKLQGIINIPASKSMCHRAMLCAGLSDGISIIKNVIFSKDIEATRGVIENLGVNVKVNENTLVIEGPSKLDVINKDFNCIESGSTLRFIIPIVATLGKHSVFYGEGALTGRPLKPYYDIFDKQNLKYMNTNGKLPLTLDGKLKPDIFKIRGDMSSQFISGLLFALPLLAGDSKIIMTSKLESKPYVELTIDILKKFSINVENKDYKEFIVKGNQVYKASDCSVEGDFSQAAFWLIAGLLGADVACSGLNMHSHQGDKVILDIIKSMGGVISTEDNKIKAQPSKTNSLIIDVSECPDLVPILAVLASLSSGTTKIINAGKLRLKESDRLKAISSELNKLGANIEEKEDSLIIHGKQNLRGGAVESWNDHRIAMALAIASLRCKEPTVIKDADCVKKSYPDFWKDFRKLGGEIHEWSLGQ